MKLNAPTNVRPMDVELGLTWNEVPGAELYQVGLSTIHPNGDLTPLGSDSCPHNSFSLKPLFDQRTLESGHKYAAHIHAEARNILGNPAEVGFVFDGEKLTVGPLSEFAPRIDPASLPAHAPGDKPEPPKPGNGKKEEGFERLIQNTRQRLVDLEEILKGISAEDLKRNFELSKTLAAEVSTIKSDVTGLKAIAKESVSKKDLAEMEKRLGGLISEKLSEKLAAAKPTESTRTDKPVKDEKTRVGEWSNSGPWATALGLGVVALVVIIALCLMGNQTGCASKHPAASSALAAPATNACASSPILPSDDNRDLLEKARRRVAALEKARKEQAEKIRQIEDARVRKNAIVPVPSGTDLVSSNGARMILSGSSPHVIINGNVEIGDNSSVVFGKDGKIIIPPAHVVTPPSQVMYVPPVSAYFPQAQPNTYTATPDYCRPAPTYVTPAAPVYGYGGYGGSYGGSYGVPLPGVRMHAVPNPGYYNYR